MKKRLLLTLLAAAADAAGETHRVSLATLKDKIAGGWAGQTIGVTYGGPTEFRYNGTMIQPYEPIPWYDGYLLETFQKIPGLYDDIYMDFTFVEVLEDRGLDAGASDFAEAFAHRDYLLWHANQMARYNVLQGKTPPASGHWRNNPEADSIDFQIEADFAGLMSPGMPNAAAEISDRVGHIMNHGDGFYGGVYMAAMYSVAFVESDVGNVVARALETIPAESTFRKTIEDVIRWHRQYPEDWRESWFEIEKKWSEDIGSPIGVFRAFNIDAKLNAAYVVMGLLYGDGDFEKTLEVSTRTGQDSDCNPSSAAGILGVILGYEKIPARFKAGLPAIESLDFPYTRTSLREAYDLSYRHALQAIERRGGKVGASEVEIPAEEPKAVPLERNFEGHYPVAELILERKVRDETTFAFEGIGFAAAGEARSEDGKDHVLEAELYVDGTMVERFQLPTRESARRFIPVYRYELSPGRHEARVRITNPSDAAHLRLDYAIVYGAR
ncbi:MAG TPA: ADP-ribosylglycohydrolase family protein [Vicinamibacteria bacterium]|nr:ADP-ribosylglycohydrolase family protein [Vicinamibacteria bacterium]